MEAHAHSLSSQEAEAGGLSLPAAQQWTPLAGTNYIHSLEIHFVEISLCRSGWPQIHRELLSPECWEDRCVPPPEGAFKFMLVYLLWLCPVWGSDVEFFMKASMF